MTAAPSFLVVLSVALGAARGQVAVTQWDGVYTDAQATRGQTVYRRHCASCHGGNLTGTEFGPELRGKAFDEQWDGKSLADLFGRVKGTMPAPAPGSLSDRQYADVLAFVLAQAGFPSGSPELSTDRRALAQLKYAATRK